MGMEVAGATGAPVPDAARSTTTEPEGVGTGSSATRMDRVLVPENLWAAEEVYWMEVSPSSRPSHPDPGKGARGTHGSRSAERRSGKEQ